MSSTYHNAKSEEKWPIANLYGRPSQSRWEIAVQPVSRVLRHSIKQYILDSALPQMSHWLVERAQLLQRGSDLLAFFYDEETGECLPRNCSQSGAAQKPVDVSDCPSALKSRLNYCKIAISLIRGLGGSMRNNTCSQQLSHTMLILCVRSAFP